MASGSCSSLQSGAKLQLVARWLRQGSRSCNVGLQKPGLPLQRGRSRVKRPCCSCTIQPLNAKQARPWTISTVLTRSQKSPFSTVVHLPRKQCRPTSVIRAACSSGTSTGAPVRPLEVVKKELLEAVKGINLGIFGVPSTRKEEVENLIGELEIHNPTLKPTQHLEQVAGEWTLLYSTIKILGSKRTKLGLREFVKLGSFRQIIDVEQSRASNVIDFRVTGLGLLTGSFTIDASFNPVSPTRVEIKFLKSVLVPEQLLLLFEKNYDLLLSVFNPEGWLEITYVDDQLRVGRDDKDNIFLLRR